MVKRWGVTEGPGRCHLPFIIMGFDMWLFDGEQRVVHMNWLRNPFGLVQWIYDNTGIDIDLRRDQDDRALILKTVTEAYNAVMKLDKGYFHFKSIMSYRQFVEQNEDLERVPDPMYHSDANRTIIKGEMFNNSGHLLIPNGSFDAYCGRSDLEFYKKWTSELLDFCVRLQDPRLTFLISD